MAKLGSFKRIVKEDFKAEDQELIDKIAFPINSALESISGAFNKDISLEDNVGLQIKDLSLKVDATGKPSPALSFQSTLKGSARGVLAIRVENVTNITSYPAYQPYISFYTQNNNIIIERVMGLTTGNEYKIRFLVF